MGHRCRCRRTGASQDSLRWQRQTATTMCASNHVLVGLTESCTGARSFWPAALAQTRIRPFIRVAFLFSVSLLPRVEAALPIAAGARLLGRILALLPGHAQGPCPTYLDFRHLCSRVFNAMMGCKLLVTALFVVLLHFLERIAGRWP